MGAVLAAWLVELGVQVWKGGKAQRVPPGLPVPSMFVADMVLFGALAFGAKESAKAAPVITRLKTRSPLWELTLDERSRTSGGAVCTMRTCCCRQIAEALSNDEREFAAP